jgi:Flp pilus assembly protein TadG
MTKQRGIALVEFAIVAAALMIILFAVLEFGRLLFTYSALNEGTRRAARLAAVCPVNDPAIATAVDFANPPGFSSGNVALDYLDQNGAVVGAPTSAAGFVTIRYVRVRIVNYTHELLIPFLYQNITVPAFTTILPRESLGVVNGVSTAC